MFGCVKCPRGAGPRKRCGGGLFLRFLRWIRSRARGPQDVPQSAPEIVSPGEAPPSTPADSLDSLSEGDVSPPSEDTCSVASFPTDQVEDMVHRLLRDVLGDDPHAIPAFLYGYREFATCHQVLDVLSRRYGNFLWDVEEDEQVRSVICSLLSTWLDDYLDDFYEPPDFPGLETLAEYVSTIAPGSHLDRRAHIVLAEAVLADHAAALPEAPLPTPAQPESPAMSRATSPSRTTGNAIVAREEPEPPVPGALAVASLPGEGPVPAAPRKALARAQSAPTLSQTTRADHSPSPTHDHDGCPRRLRRHITLTIIITLNQNAG